MTSFRQHIHNLPLPSNVHDIMLPDNSKFTATDDEINLNSKDRRRVSCQPNSTSWQIKSRALRNDISIQHGKREIALSYGTHYPEASCRRSLTTSGILSKYANL